MKYDLRRPCPHCPFRLDVPPFLRGDRAQEIAEALAHGGGLPCHVTTVPCEEDDSERVATDDSQMCAGALIALEKGPGGPNQVMRIAERLGVYDPEKLDRETVPVGTLLEFVRHHAGGDGDDESGEMEPCSVASGGCLAPAGHLIGGEVIVETNREPTSTCQHCGEAVCDACMDEHQTEHEEEWR